MLKLIVEYKLIYVFFIVLVSVGIYFNGIRDVFRELFRNEGIFVLYKGVIFVMLRVFLVNVVSLIVFFIYLY